MAQAAAWESPRVQIGRAMGMTVIGTAGTDKGLELVRREGAHHAFNHRTAGYTDAILKATNGRGVDVVLEMLANVNLAADLKLLARFGRVIVIGSRGDITITPARSDGAHFLGARLCPLGHLGSR